MPTLRRYDLDDIRTAMVLAIVLLHAGCAYVTAVPWWHAKDQSSVFAEILLLVIDSFALPVLYFVSGIFARPSIGRHGNRGFAIAKLRRLGLPLIALPTLYLPAMVYMGYLARTPAPQGFWAYWLNWMRGLLDWSPALITSMEQGARYQDLFSPHHLWFVSLLLIFFAGFMLVRRIQPDRWESPGMGWLLPATGLAMALGYAGANLLVQDLAWARLGPFLLFQPTRLPVYAAAFTFGALCGPRLGEGARRPVPGPIWMWLALFLVSLAILFANADALLLAPSPATWPHALGHGMLRAAITLAAIGICANTARRLLARANRWRQSLAASSYDIYLLHMPLVVFVQAALIPLVIPPLAKMGLAFLAPVLFCWWLARRLAGRSPLLPALLLGAYFVFFCLMYQ